ncbi:MAG: Rho termination factor N-terminal domain-containing protein, partial [Candidatus Aureabacteria bacterium]|nr:Rho termination factor N-terminal domain-containing protein [Candidatus Auribacterota bacterium]
MALLERRRRGKPVEAEAVAASVPVKAVEKEREKVEVAPSAAPETDEMAPPPPRTAQDVDIGTLQMMNVPGLMTMARGLNVVSARSLKKHQLIFEILKARAAQNGHMFGGGVLEILPDGFGFLRSPAYNYLACNEDIYVSPSQIRKFDLRNGDTVTGEIRPPKDRER